MTTYRRDYLSDLPIFNSYTTFMEFLKTKEPNRYGGYALKRNVRPSDARRYYATIAQDGTEGIRVHYECMTEGLTIHKDDSIRLKAELRTHSRRYYEFFINNIWPGVELRSGVVVIPKSVASEPMLQRAKEEIPKDVYEIIDNLVFPVGYYDGDGVHAVSFSLTRTEDGGIAINGENPSYSAIKNPREKAKIRAKFRNLLKYAKVFTKVPMARDTQNRLKVEFNRQYPNSPGILYEVVKNPDDKSLWPALIASYHIFRLSRVKEGNDGYALSLPLLKEELYETAYLDAGVDGFDVDPYGYVAEHKPLHFSK